MGGGRRCRRLPGRAYRSGRSRGRPALSAPPARPGPAGGGHPRRGRDPGPWWHRGRHRWMLRRAAPRPPGDAAPGPRPG
ncbi:hypothetical protein ACFFX0_04315 [Citricoccus parietis]|uniref:Uncharacterized protein n=1 Tax=Citricoccus parietis TaxID=592307 RepID=A0ABV5FW04_9MICC